MINSLLPIYIGITHKNTDEIKREYLWDVLNVIDSWLYVQKVQGNLTEQMLIRYSWLPTLQGAGCKKNDINNALSDISKHPVCDLGTKKKKADKEKVSRLAKLLE